MIGVVALVLAQIVWPVTPTRAPRPTATRTPTPRPMATATPTPTSQPGLVPTATPTPGAAIPTPTPTRFPVSATPTPTPSSQRLHVEVCADIMPVEITFNWIEGGAVSWRRNKEMARTIQPSKQGIWVYADGGGPALATLGDEVTLCVGAHCIAISIPTPTVRSVPASNAAHPPQRQ